ncbi:hypothetical protein VTK73DRAFT_3437 [Phialemonium thermophilum]|uniref:Uncharacterized protein n=1 Tax=Phialemonium thermophilum TaxID=223376 RepID=A0ABR3VIB2_9PEZI
MFDIPTLALAGPLSAASTRAVRRNVKICAALWVSVAVSQTLPYIPASIFLSPCNGSTPCSDQVAYVFAPADDDSPSVQFLAINVSSTIQATSPPLQTLSQSVPFWDGSGDATTAAFTASVSQDGTILAYAGDCASSNGSSLWTYRPRQSPARWVQHPVVQTGWGAAGPALLGGGLSFAPTLSPDGGSPSSTYVYGGMCPWPNATAPTWQSAATYSNQMRKISGPSEPESAYAVAAVASSGPPVPVAGFTLTPMTPSFSNRSGTVTQQVNYVLLGGHTRHAFVNMSTAAVWSLPEETWSFVSIQAPAAGSSTELAIRDDVAAAIDSRSGHTAVLSEDGASLVVLGGWVGDLTQAASPQLIVLQMGDSFDDWQWSVPRQQPPGPARYGHGAVLLPGNVMMVYGGSEISSTGSSSSSSSSSRRRRAASHASPTFLNLTSMIWTDEYSNPLSSSASKGHHHANSQDDNKHGSQEKIGLGVGLGLGIPLLIAALALVWYCRKRAKNKRVYRDEVVRNLSQDASRFLHGADNDEAMIEQPGSQGFFPWNAHAARAWYMGGHDPYSSGERSLGYETLSAGARLRLLR